MNTSRDMSSRLMVLLFSDLVDSSKLKRDLGDVEYVRCIAQPHNTIFRELLARFPGAEGTTTPETDSW